MSNTDPRAILKRLSRNQINTLADLSPEDYCFLGCAESCAERMTKPSGKRPALTKKRYDEKSGFYGYALTEQGLLIKQAVEEDAELMRVA